MRRMKKWAAVLLAVSLVAGNMPAAYVQADGYNNIAQVFEHKDEEMSETEEQQAEGSAEKQESEPKMQEPEEPEMQESKAPAQEGRVMTGTRFRWSIPTPATVTLPLQKCGMIPRIHPAGRKIKRVFWNCIM